MVSISGFGASVLWQLQRDLKPLAFWVMDLSDSVVEQITPLLQLVATAP
jgi:hypothetical protein